MERTLTRRYRRMPNGRAVIVREAGKEDLPGIVAIHQKAFEDFFLTRLGGRFLRVYYGLVLDYGSGVVLVGEGADEQDLQGFVCGFLDPAAFYRLMWSKRQMFVWPALPALLRTPTLAAQVLHGVQRIQTSASLGDARSCELSSIAVAPEAAGNGLGSTLVHAFLERSWSMNAENVYLTTDAYGNDQANRLYHEAGFRRTRQFLQRRGRWMNEYVIRRSGGDGK